MTVVRKRSTAAWTVNELLPDRRTVAGHAAWACTISSPASPSRRRPARTPLTPPTAPRTHIGMALYGDVTFDSRVRREAATLARAGYRVTIVCLAHELFLATGTALRLPRPARSLLRRYEGRLVRRTAAVVTVNDGLADVIRRLNAAGRIEVVHNCPDRWEPPAAPSTRIRDATGIPDDRAVILYHGALSSHRGIEQLMDALLVDGLREAHLVLIGFGERRGDYEVAASAGPWRGRVHLLEPVPPAELLAWVASADVGAMPIQP